MKNLIVLNREEKRGNPLYFRSTMYICCCVFINMMIYVPTIRQKYVKNVNKIKIGKLGVS